MAERERPIEDLTKPNQVLSATGDWATAARTRFLASAVAIGYLIFGGAVLASRGGWPTPDFLIPPLLLIAVFVGRGWRFVIDWTPFLLLILIYEGFRGIADDLSSSVHFQELIDADSWLLGSSRSAPEILQDWFFVQGTVSWLDWLTTLLYLAHFVVPTAFAFYFWMSGRAAFWRFAVPLLGLFFAAFLTYYLYPAAPPWMASQQGLIPQIDRVYLLTLASLPETEPLAFAFKHFSPNEVAAVPSLHAALPLLLAFISIDIWRWRGLPVLVYAGLGSVSFVYLGEHYLVDIVLGWLYAGVAFVALWVVLPRTFSTVLQSVPLTRLPKFTPLPEWPLAALACFFILLVWINPLT